MADGGPIIREHLIFSGTVQGVGFRWRAMRAADAAGCTGWVRNDPNGTVSMEIQGSEAQIDRVIRSLDRAPYIRITDLNVRHIPVDERESDFVTRGEYW